MKNILLKARFLFVASVLLFAGCSKDDGPVKKEILELIDAVPAMQTAVDPTGSQSINMLNLAGFQGKVIVSHYFPDAKNPEKVDLIVRKNGVRTSVKVFKANITTFPITTTVSAADLATLYGQAIVLGDYYDFSLDIYANGKKYEAYPLGGVSNSSGPTGMPGYNHAVRFGAICAYDKEIYKGDFEVVSDWAGELAPGTVIRLTEVSPSSFSFFFPANQFTNPLNVPLVVNVNVGNNNISITRTNLGSTWSWDTDNYPGAALATGGAATASFVAPCDQTVTLNLNYLVNAGSFGTGPLVLKKK